ncbi:hypothetical protein M422DRAFT_260740 [Sphaerobolus stellatus SS14]|uniref:Uncharacterized protein n=1 Tax=Sphaerobolus stellatus (strain SS14) TaxID=990650 RepID=A0A0C9UQC0_SPHS4|nr:hypothetical protein M422DRAFT_260740 [Sphaerobolus stellatus SS14]
MSARKLFFSLQLPRHALPVLNNATRQVHAIFGPVEGGIDVKNVSSSFESGNVSATSRDVTLSDVESHPPDAGSMNSRAGKSQFRHTPRRNPTFITWLLLGMRRTQSSTASMISTMRFATVAFQRASTMVLTPLAFAHASTPSFHHGSSSSTSTFITAAP